MTRRERIERLLDELSYEIEVGMLKGEIDESMSFEFVVPVSKSMPNGVVYCVFYTRPMHRQHATWRMGLDEPRLKLVK